MTQHAPHGHLGVIQDAIENWWITADPSKPLDTPDAARQVEEQLLHAGFYIAPYTRKKPMTAPRPRRRTVAASIALAATVAAATLAAALTDRWWPALLGAVVTAAFTNEAIRTLAHRRNWTQP
ncbi:hypothetical protein [Streptomyces sp. NPDC050535]|uniref:hypothetical protein n=1 Tax=Streptomyces sp. NPDC050535 TaxID=3365626 RepID=UPI003799EE3E